jgi:glyoxylase-like metal-dependent hydrolase (beta-lactamase superfamily II)
MLHSLLFWLAACVAAGAAQAASSAPCAPVSGIGFSIIKTSQASTREGLAFSGGSYARTVHMNHVAILVRHRQGSFLFDTGLGRDIAAQFARDMPWWARPLFTFGPVSSARAQLEAHGMSAIGRIIVSHVHWDHASAVPDFPEAEVWLTQEESAFLKLPHRASVFPSQLASPHTRWVNYALDATPFRTFARSKDLFGDGSAVLVPLAGHTPGSVGLYLSLPSGRQFLFVGDVVWNSGALAGPHAKHWLASKIVDDDAPRTLATIAAIEAARRTNPALVLVPAHDAAVHDAIGYFPRLIE